jgi:hypothetical protein
VLARVLTVSIFGFWIVMTGLLLQSIWYPADSQLTKVSPGAVFQLITSRGESSSLDVYDDQRIVGSLTVQAVATSLNQRRRMKLRLNGRINLDRAPFAGIALTLESWADLDHDGNVTAMQLHLKTGDPGFRLMISQTATEKEPVVMLKQNDAVLFDSTALAEGKLESNPMIALLLGTLGISLPELSAIHEQAKAQADRVEMEARQGEFDLGGTARPGYILKIGTPGKAGFRLCIENSGEIVQVETPTSYRMLTESLRPAAPSPP